MIKERYFFHKFFPTAHRLLLEKMLRYSVVRQFRSVVVVGVGRDPYRYLFSKASEYVRIDLKFMPSYCDVVGDALALPFESGHFDCVFSSEVFEHVSNPDIFVGEAERVLRTGGTVIATIPFMFHIHGDPQDFWRPTRQGLFQLFGRFSEVSVMPYGNSIHVISDLLTTAFTPCPIFVPFRILNHLLALFPGGRSYAPSGYIVIGRK